MTDKHVLITGGAGYIGSLLTSELLRANYRVTVLDSLLFGGESIVPFIHHPNFHFVKADVTGPRAVRDALKGDWQNSDQVAARALIDQAAQLAGGPLSGLINSASIFDYDTPGAIKPDILEAAMAVNLRAPALLSERFFAQADPARDNCIINMLDQKLWNMNPDFFS